MRFSAIKLTQNDRAKLFLLILFWTLTFLPVYPDMVRSWLTHTDNSHGILVPFISLYFIWRKREKLTMTEGSTSSWGAIILVLSLMFYFTSYAGGIVAIQRSMIVFSLVGLILFILGKSHFKLISFPLFFLLFMVPVPDSILSLIAFPLQLYVTRISEFIIRAFAIPVYREGNMLYFSHAQLEVTASCSGIRFITSYLMMSVILAYLMNKGWVRRTILVVSAIPLAFLNNIVRVTCIGLLVTFWGDKAVQGLFHEFSGLVFFVLGFGLFFIEYLVLNKNGL